MFDGLSLIRSWATELNGAVYRFLKVTMRPDRVTVFGAKSAVGAWFAIAATAAIDGLIPQGFRLPIAVATDRGLLVFFNSAAERTAFLNATSPVGTLGFLLAAGWAVEICVLLLLAILIVDRRGFNVQRFNFLFGCAATLILASTAWSSIGLAFMEETIDTGSSGRWPVAVFVVGVLMLGYAAVIVLAGLYGLAQRNFQKAAAASCLFVVTWLLVPTPLAFYREEPAEAGTISSATNEAWDLSQAGKFEDGLAVLAGLATDERTSLQAQTAAIAIHINAIRSALQGVQRHYDSRGEPLLAAAREADSHRSRLIEQLASIRGLHGSLSAVQLFLADVDAAVLGDCAGARINYRATLLNGDALSIEKARALPRLACLCGAGCADADVLSSQDVEDVPWPAATRRYLDLLELQLAAMTRQKYWRSGRLMDPAEVLGTSEESNILNKSYVCSCDKVAEMWTEISAILASDQNR